MQVSKSVSFLVFTALLLSGCGDSAKSKFQKGKDQTELFRSLNVCASQPAKMCVFSEPSEVRKEDLEASTGSPSERMNKTTVSSKTEVDAAKAAGVSAAYGKGYKEESIDAVLSKNSVKTSIELKLNLQGTRIEALQELKKLPSKEDIAKFITYACLNKIEQTFNDSDLKLGLLLNFSDIATSESEEKTGALLQVDVSMPRVDLDSDKDHPRLVMSKWPFHSDLFVPAEVPVRCEEDKDCVARAKQSDGFCRSLAKLVGHKLGLNDPIALKGECGKTSIKSTVASKEVSKIVSNVPNDDEFWAKPFLIKSRDQFQIHRPRCSDQNAVKKAPKKKNNKDDKTTDSELQSPSSDFI